MQVCIINIYIEKVAEFMGIQMHVTDTGRFSCRQNHMLALINNNQIQIKELSALVINGLLVPKGSNTGFVAIAVGLAAGAGACAAAATFIPENM